MKTNIIIIVCGLPFTCNAASSLPQDSSKTHPNLLYIFADQYRLNALSIWGDPEFRHAIRTIGDPVYTPNLDKLAKGGIVFTQACSTAPISSPHRAMLITGMYPEKNGVEMNCYKGRTQGVLEDIECFTDVLAKTGYETAYIGKTHWQRNQPYFDTAGNYVGTTIYPGGNYVFDFDTYIPEGRGRKSNKFWFQQLNDNHFNAIAFSNIPELIGGNKDGVAYRPHRFTPEVEADIIIKYLKNKNGERDASKPFSLFWAINPPHPPYSKISHCKKNIYDKYYKDMTIEELLLRPNVQYGEGTKIKNLKQLSSTAKVYFSLIKSVDEEIGRVLNTLEAEGLANNTLVIFSADHGEMMGSHGYFGKGMGYEEALMIPFILRYPSKIKPQINDLMFGATDIMPTLLGIMGLSQYIPSTVMGRDYSKNILNREYDKINKPQSAFYYMIKEKGVRTNKYTYIVRDGDYRLFNLEQDPYQMHSIKLEEIPEKDVKFLKSELGKWLQISQDKWGKERKYPNLIIY